MRLVPVVLALALGCKGEDPESKPPDIDTEPRDSEGEDCVGGQSPVITEIWTENTGMQPYEKTEEYPTLTVWVTAEDEDWDLDSFHLDIYYDATVDGTVDAGTAGVFSSAGTFAEEDCGADEGTAGIVLYLMGGGVEYDSLYEWGGVITDSNGYSSEMAICEGWTPTATGEDGGA